MDDGQEEKKEPDDDSSEEVDIDADMDAMNNALKQGAQANSDNIFAGMVQDSTGQTSAAAGNDNIKKVRMYDLSITYDLWTQTPRLWLQGYSEDGDLLTQEEMFQDIMADYAKKTVTYEKHERIGQS